MKFFLILLLPLLFACQLIDQPEIAPSFIQIESFDFNINNSGQGSESSKITDVWVYANNNLEGVYELPATLPLHYQGNTDLALYPGIKRNGISTDRKKYPFYEPYIVKTNLIPDSVIEIHPSTQYDDDLFI